MPHDGGRILALKHPLAAWPEFFGTAAVWETDASLPPELLAREWEYLFSGQSARILDGRLFHIVREYILAEQPDMVFLSTPARRLLTATHTRPDRIYETMCRTGCDLYALGNKLFSRKLLSPAPQALDAAWLTDTLCRVGKLTVLSHPWCEAGERMRPDDDQFFRLADHYAGATPDARRQRWS